jgi:hypothetical protein
VLGAVVGKFRMRDAIFPRLQILFDKDSE